MPGELTGYRNHMLYGSDAMHAEIVHDLVDAGGADAPAVGPGIFGKQVAVIAVDTEDGTGSIF